MNPASLIVARYLAVHGRPSACIIDGVLTYPESLNVAAITAFCWREFLMVPSATIASHVLRSLQALAKEQP